MSCSLGHLDDEDVQESKHPKRCTGALKTQENFTHNDCLILQHRTNHQDIENICETHELYYLKFYSEKNPYCIQPQNLHPENKTKAAPNVISLNFYLSVQVAFPNIKPGQRLCVQCYTSLLAESKKLVQDMIRGGSSPFVSPSASQPALPCSQSTHTTGSSQTVGDSGSSFHPTPRTEAETDIEKLNTYLTYKNIAIDLSQVNRVSYCSEKFHDIMVTVRNTLESAAQSRIRVLEDDLHEMLAQLKEKFSSASSYGEKVAVLSVLPKSWTRNRIMEEFNIKSTHLVALTKKLVEEQGILPVQHKKAGHGFSQEILLKVKQFYEEDDQCVYMLPGKRECFSVKIGDKKERVQKRLLLNNVNELYAIFCSQNPDIKISFSSFAALRPRYCVLAGSAGTHTVCVCSYHQNVQLMVDGAGFKMATKNDDHPISDTTSLLALICCNPTTEKCAFGKCEDCPGGDKLLEIIEVSLDIECMESVTYNQWVKRADGKYWTLESMTKPRSDFAECLVAAAQDLVQHDFIAMKQKEFFSDKRKNNLKDGEALVIMDFSQNYSFVIQQSIQSYHWSNDRATVHPFIAYYKNNGELCHENYVIISDYLKHVSEAVHVFKKKFLEFLKARVPAITHVVYITDGCSSQYKSYKTVSDLCFHEVDFGLSAEHHYFATSHGKTANDGLGGTLKRTATHASLRGAQITTAVELYEWSQTTVPQETAKISFGFVSKEDIQRILPQLQQRHELAISVPQIMQIHCIKSISKTRVETKYYSTSPTVVTCKVRKEREVISDVDINDYVIILDDEHWCLAKITEKKEGYVNVELYSPHGRASKYFPSTPAVAKTVRGEQILAKVKPTVKRTWSGETVCTINQTQQKKADKQLKLYNDETHFGTQKIG